MREILNEYKWREDLDLNKLEIWYIHRGAPNDLKIISGEDIVNIERSFMLLSDANIPFHRISRILYDGNEIFKRTDKD